MPSVDVFTVTFNAGREYINPLTFARHLVNALPRPKTPEILVLSLQELAPIAYSFLGGSFLTSYFEKYRHAIHLATESREDIEYENFITRNVGMTAIMAFVLTDKREHIKSLETGGVGVGMSEMGNKGAVGLRFEYSVGEDAMELSVVAAHLAPMEEAVERRNQDWKNIVQRLVFVPVDPSSVLEPTQRGDGDSEPLLPGSLHAIGPESGLYKRTSYIILAGDLNYRTSSTKPLLSDVKDFPRPTEDLDDPRHWSHLLQHDQLSREIKAQKTCHGLNEAAINFPPTYKYSDKQQAIADVEDGSTWDWAWHRWPSWCDRILYLDLPTWTKKQVSSLSIHVHAYNALPLMSTSDHRPVALSVSIPLTTSEDEVTNSESVNVHPPFEIDPKWRERRNMARRKELFAGLTAFLGSTWEGNSIIIAVLVGAIGGWALVTRIMKSLF